MRHRRATVILGIVCLLFVGSGCEEGDVSLIVNFVSDYMQAKGMIDKNGKPTSKAMTGYMFGTGDSTIDAALNAGASVKGVREADKAIEKADEARGSGNAAEEEKQLAIAAENRPNDWAVINRQYRLDLERGRLDAAAKKGEQALSVCSTDRCKAALLEDRTRIITADIDAVSNMKDPKHDKACVMLKARRSAFADLGRQYEGMSLAAYGIGG
ncbi:MAG TPA: hypothetical protein VL500_06040, partial [Candidatus Eisenbacteria bacterium]|nr:hypothetical protein [Candidatus Eisenbacteria bacterium]